MLCVLKANRFKPFGAEGKGSDSKVKGPHRKPPSLFPWGQRSGVSADIAAYLRKTGRLLDEQVTSISPIA